MPKPLISRHKMLMLFFHLYPGPHWLWETGMAFSWTFASQETTELITWQNFSFGTSVWFRPGRVGGLSQLHSQTRVSLEGINHSYSSKWHLSILHNPQNRFISFSSWGSKRNNKAAFLSIRYYAKCCANQCRDILNWKTQFLTSKGLRSVWVIIHVQNQESRIPRPYMSNKKFMGSSLVV